MASAGDKTSERDVELDQGNELKLQKNILQAIGTSVPLNKTKKNWYVNGVPVGSGWRFDFAGSSFAGQFIISGKEWKRSITPQFPSGEFNGCRQECSCEHQTMAAPA